MVADIARGFQKAGMSSLKENLTTGNGGILFPVADTHNNP